MANKRANGKAIAEPVKAGAPTKYRPEHCEAAIDHLSQGLSLTALAGKLEVHKDTIYEWIDKHPEFSVAIKEGRAKGQAQWEESLRQQAVCNQGNTAAHIFAMKNLYPDDWRDNATVDHRHAHLHVVEDTDNRQLARAVVQLLSSGIEDDKSLELLSNADLAPVDVESE